MKRVFKFKELKHCDVRDARLWYTNTTNTKEKAGFQYSSNFLAGFKIYEELV